MADFGIGVPDGIKLPIKRKRRQGKSNSSIEIARLSLGSGGDVPPLPAPPQNSAGVIPVDITTKFRSACKSKSH